MNISTDWYGTDLCDMLGKRYSVGDDVVYPFRSGNSADMKIVKVTKIDLEKNKIYLNGSKVALNYPGRCLIVTGLNLENNE